MDLLIKFPIVKFLAMPDNLSSFGIALLMYSHLSCSSVAFWRDPIGGLASCSLTRLAEVLNASNQSTTPADGGLSFPATAIKHTLEKSFLQRHLQDKLRTS